MNEGRAVGLACPTCEAFALCSTRLNSKAPSTITHVGVLQAATKRKAAKQVQAGSAKRKVADRKQAPAEGSLEAAEVQSGDVDEDMAGIGHGSDPAGRKAKTSCPHVGVTKVLRFLRRDC